MYRAPAPYQTTVSHTLATVPLKPKHTTSPSLKARKTTSHMKRIFSTLLFCAVAVLSIAQSTYTVGSTEYYYDRSYSTTGLPMVKRSEANRAAFLRSRGYTTVPYGYEVDHIIPLSQGGIDAPSNMQLLTVEEHKRKTAQERTRSTTYQSVPSYRSSHTAAPRYTPPQYTTPRYATPQYTMPRYSIPSSYGVPSRTIYTGPRGGQYYINSNGNKTYRRR